MGARPHRRRVLVRLRRLGGLQPADRRMMDRFGPRVVMELGVLLMAAGLLLGR